MTEVERPIGVDLFCGAGGMSLGFEQAGFRIVTAVDVDPIHIATYSENFPDCTTIQADISELSGEELRSRADLDGRAIDVVFGGPPCGGFSLMGRRRPDDPRNELLGHFARLVEELNPCYFVVENVEGLLGQPMTIHLESFRKRVREAGFGIVDPIQILDASNFGVPQRRQRIFIIGYQSSLPAPEYPIPPFTDDDDRACHHPTVWDAISDLPNIDEFDILFETDVYRGELAPAKSRYAKILRGEIRDPEDFSRVRERDGSLTGCSRSRHTSDTVRRFAAAKPGTREPISRFSRLTRDGLSPTLRAGTDAKRGSYSAARPIHPVHPRCITVREGARLHSFPDWFAFHNTKWHGFRQVGNAVPPLLARALAMAVKCAVCAHSRRM